MTKTTLELLQAAARMYKSMPRSRRSERIKLLGRQWAKTLSSLAAAEELLLTRKEETKAAEAALRTELLKGTK